MSLDLPGSMSPHSRWASSPFAELHNDAMTFLLDSERTTLVDPDPTGRKLTIADALELALAEVEALEPVRFARAAEPRRGGG